MEPKDVDAPSVDAAADDPGRAELPADPALAAAVDEALIGDILAGLPEAQPNRTLRSATDFSSLYVRHRSGLAAHARRYLRDPRDVDEVVQETFLRLFLAISEIETEIQAIAFARRTLTNLCIDRYRADRRRPTMVTLDAGPFFDVTGAEEEPDPVLQAEDAAIVRDALARLSPLHREALVKREIEEKALPQIAAELGVPEESVKHLLFRARRALRRLLTGTSVQPGIDLTGEGEQPRPASALIRGATVFVLFLVGALVVATGVRPLLSGGSPSQPATGGVGTVPSLDGPDLGTGPVAPTPGHPKRVGTKPAGTKQHGHHGGAKHAAPVTGSAVSPGSSPDIRIIPPKPASGSKQPSGGHASRAHFKLRGSGLTVTGHPQVTQGGVANDGNGATVALSSFNAPTDQGFFDLVQTVKTSPTTGTAVVVQPHFVVGSTTYRPELTGSAAAVGTDPAGNVTIQLRAGARADASAGSFPLSALTANLVLAPDLSRVLSETVTLSTRPAAPKPVSAGPAGPPVKSPPAASPPPSNPPVVSPPATAAPDGAAAPDAGETATCPAPAAIDVAPSGATVSSPGTAAGCPPGTGGSPIDTADPAVATSIPE